MTDWLWDITRFQAPEALLVLLIAWPAVLVGAMRRRPAMRFSSSIPLEGSPRTLRARLWWVPTVLRILAVTLLAVALARPQHGQGETRVKAEGVAIMMVVDRSWSMVEQIEYDGELMPRIDVVKRVFREFVEGNGDELRGRPHDMIGLVAFAKFADTVCPLVRSHDVLMDLVDSISLVHPRENQYEAGTAIGEGAALAGARLEKAEEQLLEAAALEGEADPDFTIKSKIIILLTDGAENMKAIPAQTAAEFCKDLGIKIHAIGIGSDDDRGRGVGLFGRGATYRFEGEEIEQMAEMTGGLYRVVSDGEALRDVYAEIDALEKTEIESIEHTSYAERFAVWAAAGAGLLLLELVLGATVLRRSP